ncbi:MAG: hypothetical protein ACFHWX_02440 [Bacteroidota bacterium]
MIKLLIFSFLPLQESKLEGHWIKITGEGQSSCTEELIFKPNSYFKILEECFEDNEIYEVASGQYMTDGPVLYLNGLIFSSRVSDYYTQEYTRLEYEIYSDTLKFTIHRFESEERYFIRY